jgi:hypothetical protein
LGKKEKIILFIVIAKGNYNNYKLLSKLCRSFDKIPQGGIFLELNKRLYHYTQSETLYKLILKNMKIKFSKYQFLNDPRESKTWPFVFYSKESKDYNNFSSKFFEDFSKYILDNSYVFCCSRDNPQANENKLDISFQSGFGHPRMWAQYAQNHTGVCIAFNKEKLHKAISITIDQETLFYGPVEYLNSASGPQNNAYHIQYIEDIYKKGISATVNSLLPKYSKEYFFTKHLDWQDEWEYRWICFSNKFDDLYIPIEDCIEEIIIGQDCSEFDIMEIKKACNLKNIKLSLLQQHGWSMSLSPLSEEKSVSLDGVSFSTLIPCAGVYAQGHDNLGKIVPIRIDSNDGSVRILKS